MIISGLILGALLGFVMQRGRFCVTGAFRDVWISKKTRWLTAFLIAIAVQSVGVFALQSAGVIELSAKPLPWLAVTVGSLIFGIGIVLSGGCATGTYYRSGEGLVGSWLALILYATTSAAMKYGPLKAGNTAVREPKVAGATTIHDSLGISPWFLVAILVAIVGYVTWRHLRARTMKVATLPPQHSGLRHLLFEKAWHPFATAVVVGLLAIAAFPLSYATGRESGLGITTPSADAVAWLTTGNPERMNWGTLLIIGILLGSFLAAKGSGEFRIRVPDARTTLRSIGGGAMMGIGASWAGGCTIGNSLVQTAQFSYQGWVAFGFTLLGVGIATRFFILTHHREGAFNNGASGDTKPSLVNA